MQQSDQDVIVLGWYLPKCRRIPLNACDLVCQQADVLIPLE
jgi:hypothetical protein